MLVVSMQILYLVSVKMANEKILGNDAGTETPPMVGLPIGHRSSTLSGLSTQISRFTVFLLSIQFLYFVGPSMSEISLRATLSCFL